MSVQFVMSYRSMNVDHLLVEEVEHELVIRNVAFRGGESVDSKKRKLRNILRQNRNERMESLKYIVDPSEGTKELIVVDEKLAMIRDRLENRKTKKIELPVFKTRLIHLYFRLIRLREICDTEQLENAAARMLNEHFSLFSSDPEVRERIEEEIVQDINDSRAQVESEKHRDEEILSEEEDSSDSEREEHRKEKTSTPKRVIHEEENVFERMTKDILEKLINHVDKYIDRRFTSLHNESKSPEVTASTIKDRKSRTVKLPAIETLSHPEPAKSKKKIVLPQDFVTDTEDYDSNNEQYNNSDNDTERPTILKRRPRSVADWKMKYDGKDEGKKLNKFITEVEFMAEAENLTKRDLFNEAIHLFISDARTWFIEGKHNQDFRNWNELVTEMKLEFQPPDMDFHYEQQAMQRRQKRSEKFQDFYNAEMEIFRYMAVQPSEQRMFDIIFRNLRSDYKNVLVVKGIRTLKALKQWGRKLDSANIWMYRGKESEPPQRTASVHEVAELPFQKVRKPEAKAWKPSESPKYRPAERTNWKSSSAVAKPFVPQKTFNKNVNAQEGSSMGNLNKRVLEYRVPDRLVCFNCRDRNHHHETCLQDRTIFCTNCGFYDYTKENCPFCLKKRGKFGVGGRRNKFKKPPTVFVPFNSEVNELQVKVEGDNRPFAKINVLGICLIGLLDSGAQVSILGAGSEQLIRKFKLKVFPTATQLSTAGGDRLEVIGYVNLPVTLHGVTKILATLVAPALKRSLILGINFWKLFDIQPVILQPGEEIAHASQIESIEQQQTNLLTQYQQNQLEEVKQKFKVFTDGDYLETTPLIEHTITFTDEYHNTDPVRLNPYPWSPQVQDHVNKELDKWIESGVVERSTSDWALLIVPVVKKNDGTDSEEFKVRMCLDARKLNDRTRRDAYPLPHQDRILGRLGASKYLSTIDLSKAFWQIPLSVESRKYTAFRVFGRGLFQFTRLPFGLVNSPATLSRLMDQVLGYGELEPNVFVYLDDIVIASNTFEEHLRSLKEVAKRLNDANLSINMEKSKFCVPELPYLGFILSQNGIRPNPDKVEAIINFERPSSVRSLRRFLGMVNYYRRFIEEFSEMTAPLTDLLKGKPKVVVWNETAEEAFSTLKNKLITAPILSCPDFERPFKIQTDASDIAIAGILTQENDEGEHVIAYFSRKLTTPERSWKAAEKEGLAALESIEKFRAYVEGSSFELITDSSALSFIMNTKWKPSSKLSRWSMLLQQYDMHVSHRKGKMNVVADALSRAVEAMEVAIENDWYSRQFRMVQSDHDSFADFKIENGKLYKFVSAATEVLDYRYEWKLCVPEKLRKSILKEEHDDCLHPGYEKTVQRIKTRYYWPRMAVDIKRHVQACDVCKQSKPSTRPTAPEMGKRKLTNRPFQILALDFIQSLPRSKNGNGHLLVLMDIFSKWTILVPTKKIEAKSVCKIVENDWIRRYGTPEVVISDNATVFVGKEFQAMLQRRGIQHWPNARHHSQANPVERINRTINACLRTYMQPDQRVWDTRVAEVEEMLNTSIHSSTGFTPYQILYGHEKVVKGEEHRLERDEGDLSVEARDRYRKEVGGKTFDLVQRNLQKSDEKCRRVYNLRHKRFAPTYQVGEKVFKRNFRQSSAAEHYNAKYGPLYTPCVIASKRGCTSYELVDDQGKNLGVFSASDIRPSNEKLGNASGKT